MVGYAMKMGTRLTANPGDRIVKKTQTIEEKAKQIAVDRHDLTGAHIKVPTYFIVKYPNGETEALHHVRDAKKISDVIRQMKFEEDHEYQGNEIAQSSGQGGFMPLFLISMLLLSLMTGIIVIGIF